MKIITTTRKKKRIIVDDYFTIPEGCSVTVSSHGYPQSIEYLGKIDGKYKYKKTYIHHLVIGKPPKELETDHINGDRLDNRRNNLRFCTHSDNAKNTKRKKGKYKGVYLQKGRWIAQITSNYKCHHIGSFNTPKDAAIAYNKAAVKLHGEFARLNTV